VSTGISTGVGTGPSMGTGVGEDVGTGVGEDVGTANAVVPLAVKEIVMLLEAKSLAFALPLVISGAGVGVFWRGTKKTFFP